MNKLTIKAIALTIILSSLPATAKTGQDANQSISQNSSSLMQWWSNRNTATKVAIGGAALLGGAFGLFKAAPLVWRLTGKLFKLGGRASQAITFIGGPIITYLTIKSFVKPKTEDRSWTQEIKSDMDDVLGWVKNLFSKKSVQEDDDQDQEEEEEEEEEI